MTLCELSKRFPTGARIELGRTNDTPGGFGTVVSVEALPAVVGSTMGDRDGSAYVGFDGETYIAVRLDGGHGVTGYLAKALRLARAQVPTHPADDFAKGYRKGREDSRVDYDAGYADGWRMALASVTAHVQKVSS